MKRILKFSPGILLSTWLVLLASLAAATAQTQGSSCTPPPAGIVGWWKGDGTAVDVVGGNNGVLVNVTYTNGVVGQAFACDPEIYPYGTYTGVQIADQPAYALTNALTIEGWIRPRGDGYNIFWRGDNRPGLDPYLLSMQNGPLLAFYVTDANANYDSVGVTLTYGNWVHVAATLDGSAGTLNLYTNGVLAAQKNTAIRPFGSLIAGDSPGIGIGNVNDGFNNFPFLGDIDEIALYNRALAPAEIQAIYNAGSAGKCVPGVATNNCATPPAGLVSWWPGEGNANDVTGGNSGTWVGTGNLNAYAPGVVGQAMVFDGTHRDRVNLGNPVNLQLQDFTIEAWVQRSSATVVSWDENFNDGSIAGPGGYIWGYGAGGYGLVVFDDGSVGLTQDTVNDTHVPPVLTDTNWHHVAVAKAGTAVTFFVDGVQQPTPSLSPYTNVFTFTTPVAIASRGDGGGNTFYGSIDELTVYSRALTASEVSAIYNAGSAGKCAPVTTTCAPLPAGIVAWWPAEGNVNDIAGTNNGLVTQGTISYVPGEVGLAFNFDGGANRIVVPDAPALNFGAGQDFSAETWIRAYPQPGNWNGGIETIFDKRVAPDSITQLGYNFSLDPNGHFSFQMADTLAQYSWHNFNAPSPYLEDGQWHHIAATVVRNSTNGGNLYVDGVVVLNFDPTVCPGSLVNSGPFRIGNHADTNDNLYTYFSGNIDELSLYDRALSSNEIAAIYNAGSAGKCQASFPISGLVLWNTLGSDTEVSNSVYGPNLQKYVGGSWPDVAANTSYGPGKFGNAVGIGPGGYISESRVHNLVLNNLAQCINPNQGTIDVWFLQNWTPTAYVDGAIRIFDGDYGLNSGMGFVSLPPPNNLAFGLTFGGTTTAVNYDITASNGTWLNLAGIWDIAGIDGSADKLRLFVNGQLVAAATNATWGTTVGSQADIAGGEDSDCAGQFLVDNLKVFNRALTANEVAQVYGGGEGFASGPPAIYNFSPAAATNGAVVAIIGTNFSANAATDIVYFGAVRANVLAASPTSLTVTVPTGATYAPITVTVGGLIAYANAPFLVTFAGSGSTVLAPRLDLPASDGPGFTAFADLDGDGKPDLLVLSGSVLSIYQNLGTTGTVTAGSFAPRLDLPLPAGMDAMTVADVDGDGRLDIVLLNRSLDQVMILQNLSTPGLLTTNSFAAPVAFSTGSDPRGLAVRDLDGDGKPELIVGNWGDSTVSVFYNTGAGGITTNSFAPAVIFAVGANPQGLAVADLDGDGQPDIVTANNNYGTTNSVSILRNISTLGNIAFAPSIGLAGLPTCYGIAVGDLDGDGKLDLAVSSFDQGQSVSVYRNTSSPGSLTTSSFAPDVDFSAGGWGNAVAMGDLDGDGKPDLAVVTQLPDHLSIFKNISTPGSFTTSSLAPRVDYPTGWNPNGVAIGDIDGDGRADIAFAVSYAATLSIYQNETPTPVTVPVTNPPAITAITPAIGTPGTIITLSGTNFNPVAASNIVYFGAVQANVLATSPTSLTVTVPTGATFAPITVTVNGLVASSSQPFEPTFIGDGSSISVNSFAASFNLATGANPGSAIIADLDGDGKPDIAEVNGNDHTVSIFRNISTNGALLSAASFAPRVDLPFPAGGTSGNPYRLRAVDLDGDGKLDLIAAEVSGNRVSIFHNIATPGTLTTNSFEPGFALIAGNDCRFATAADLDGDGRVDIIALNYGDNTISIFKNIGTAGSLTTNSFATPVNLISPGGPYEVAVGDLDGDGKPDLAVANSSASVISVFRNTTTPGILDSNSFAPRVDFPSQANGATITIGDLDGDGKADVIAGFVNPQIVSVYRNLSTPGSFDTNSLAPSVDFSTPGWMHTVALGDINGDGKPDICVVGELPSFMAVFQNLSTPGSFTTASLAPQVDFGTGWNAWGIAVGDLDGDGRPDIIFCNNYDNTLTIYQNQMPFGTAPVITTQPTNQNVAVGDTAIFAVTVQGASPLNFQWSFNGTNLIGATNSALTLTNVQLSQAGNYALLATNSFGSTASSNALLSVFVPAIPPAILSQTPNQVVLLGNTATFSVAASGSDPLSYVWSRNGLLIPGATNASYSLNNAQLSDSGSQFNCLVTNAYGSAASTNVTLKVIDTIANDLCSGAIVISTASYTNLQSTADASSFGDPVPDCVDGFGNGVWYQFTAPVNGVLIVDTFGSDFDTGLAIYTGSCDSLTEVACNDDTGGVTSQVTIPTSAGTTYYILAGGYGAHTGNLVIHLNHQTPPAFAVQPADKTVVAGSNANFSATLTGAAPMSFQWYFNGTALVDDGIHIAGSLTSSLILSNVTTADAGSYSLAVTNFLGSASSSNAALTVLVPPTFTTQPVGRSVPPGLPTTFNATASGNPAPSYYQWQINGTNIPGATSSSYTIAAVGTNDLGFYQLVASNLVGVTVSADAQLTYGPVAAWGYNSFGQCLPPPGLSNVISVAGGIVTSLAVRTDGTVVSWGSSNGTNVPASASNVVAVAATGQVGNYALRADGTVVSWAGSLPPALSNVVAVAAGFNFGMALRAEGTVVGWGDPPFATVPAGLNHVTTVACGFTHSLALRSDGTVTAWGTGSATNVPAGLTNVTAIAAGYSHSLALKTNGLVVAWGSGSGTNLPAGLTNVTAISTENSLPTSFSLALRADGTVVTWGESPYGETNPPAALSNLLFVAIAAAPNHGLALVNDGSPVILHPPVGLTAYTGRNVTLQGSAAGAQPLSYQWLLNGTNIPDATNTSLVLSNVQFSNAGNYQLFVSNRINTALSLAAPLTVISNNILTFLSQPAAQTNIYQGGKLQLGTAVLGSGPLTYQWYFSPTVNSQTYTPVSGATNDSLTFDPALASETGYYYVSVNNSVSRITSLPVYVRVLFAKAWGILATDPPFNVTNATAIAVGNAGLGTGSGHYLALKSDGKIASWSGGFVTFGETNVTALSNAIVTAIAAGYEDSLALKSDSTVYAWGDNIYGETNVPAGLSGITAIACGNYHDLALKADGTVVGWGQNIYFQTTNAAATNVVAIAAGGQDSMALRADGSVVAWGFYGPYLPSLIPSPVTNVIAIAAGGSHYLALRANGTVVGWGNNAYGQTTIPAGISNIVAISAGANHSVLLRNDGTVVALGAYMGSVGGFSIVSPPSDLANVAAIASSGDHDLALFGTRAPAFTVQPWSRTVFNTATSVWFSAKCAGVQPVSYQWRFNGTNLPAATNDTLTVNATITNTYTQKNVVIPLQSGVYQLIASNAYGVVASKYAQLTVLIPLGVALNATNLNWTTTGEAKWFGETNVTHDGVSAAQSGDIGPLQETILQTTFGTNQAGSYSFWWKVSSELDFDFLEFRINGIVQTNISGTVDWQPVVIPVAAGTNVLMWRYSKESIYGSGLDAGWVDQFAYLPAPPVITVQPVSQIVNYGTNVTLRVTATGGTPDLHYQWQQNGYPSGGNSSVLALSRVGRAQNGTYFVTVTNAGGSTVSSNAVLKVLVPQLLAPPQLLPNGTLLLTSTDANGGLLSAADLANFEAQASTNLVDWVTLPNALSLTNGMLQLQDSGSNYTARYYRIIEQ